MRSEAAQAGRAPATPRCSELSARGGGPSRPAVSGWGDEAAPPLPPPTADAFRAALSAAEPDAGGEDAGGPPGAAR